MTSETSDTSASDTSTQLDRVDQERARSVELLERLERKLTRERARAASIVWRLRAGLSSGQPATPQGFLTKAFDRVAYTAGVQSEVLMRLLFDLDALTGQAIRARRKQLVAAIKQAQDSALALRKRAVKAGSVFSSIEAKLRDAGLFATATAGPGPMEVDSEAEVEQPAAQQPATPQQPAAPQQPAMPPQEVENEIEMEPADAPSPSSSPAPSEMEEEDEEEDFDEVFQTFQEQGRRVRLTMQSQTGRRGVALLFDISGVHPEHVRARVDLDKRQVVVYGVVPSRTVRERVPVYTAWGMPRYQVRQRATPPLYFEEIVTIPAKFKLEEATSSVDGNTLVVVLPHAKIARPPAPRRRCMPRHMSGPYHNPFNDLVGF